MVYVRPTIVDGVTVADADFFNNVLDGIDERLDQGEADARYAPIWQVTTAVELGAVRILPDGSIGTRTTAGTTRATFDATESALWTRTTGSGGGYDGGTI